MKAFPRWLPAVFFVSTGFALVVLFKFFGGNIAPSSIGKPQAKLANYGQVADFALVNQNNQLFTSKSLHGKAWIADFIFTRCAGMCPILSTRMSKLQANFIKTNSQVQLVSFSVDPEWDSPEKLKAYAQRFEANTQSWSFVTGTRKELERLIKKSFKLSVASMPADDPQAIGEIAGDNQRITHSDRLVLVDKNMHIRGYYHGMDKGSLKLIMRDLGRLRND